MRVDKSGFYMHCRLRSLQAAVHFYVIGGAYGGHREGGFSVPPTIFTPSLCHYVVVVWVYAAPVRTKLCR